MDIATPCISDGVVTVRLHDDLDAATAPGVATLLHEVVQRGSRVVLDMGDVAFMDCAGLAELLRAHRRAAEGGGWLRLTAVPEVPMLVLRLTETAELLSVAVVPSQRSGDA